MDKAWFHHLITGFLSLAGIRKNDLDEFCSRFSYQANNRLIRALKINSDYTHIPHDALDDSWYIPDRSALFHQIQANNTPAKNLVPVQNESYSSITREVISSDTRIPGKESRVLLPKYIKPQQELQELEVDDELAGLEDRLLADISEDEIKEQQLNMDKSSDDNNKPPPPTRVPIMERMSLNLDNHAFGRPIPARSIPNADFIHWLNRFTELSSQNSANASVSDQEKDPEILDKVHEVRQADLLTPDKQAKSGSKKKKKKRKEAKLLAKASVRKSNEIATETLASLLVQQGHNEQAIEMYERLILIFPEKKSTFAAQIAKIKRKQI